MKMKIGSHPDDDLRRVRVAKEAIGEASLFVDANGAYSVKQALRMADAFAAEAQVAWFEEPVSSDDLDGLAQVRTGAPDCMDIAAGEYSYNADDVRHILVRRAVDVQQADASRCLGITGFLAVGALCDAHHIDLSGHCAPASCMFMPPAQRRVCVIWNGSMTTFASSTCCSTALPSRRTARSSRT